MTDVTAKKLETVRALLAKADGTPYPEEADAFRAKADALMTAFAIEQWQVDQAQAGTQERVKPVKREFNFDWWYRSDRHRDLWSMFLSVAHHCRCVVAVRGQEYKRMPVIGLPSDLDYFDMLFTHLMVQMAKQLEPKPNPALSFDENCYALRAAGTQRMRVIQMMYEANLIPDHDTGDCIGGYAYWMSQPGMEKKMRAKVRTAAERWAKKNGLDSTTTVAPAVWQRSFANGFVREVGHRLFLMRREQEAPVDDGPSVALAIRDIYDQALSLYDELFPPVEVDPDAKPVRSRAMVRELRYDTRAYRKGAEAGQKANLSTSPQRGLKNQRELPK